MKDEVSTRVLVALGADQQALTDHDQIPMDLARGKLKDFLMSHLARPRLSRAFSREKYAPKHPKKLGDVLHPDHVAAFALKLEEEVNKRMEMSVDVTLDAAAFMQLREIDSWKKTMSREQLSLALYPRVSQGSRKLGSRILFLDGGGMRGLVEIEILIDIERRTGHKITELFDWIVGTSTGGIVALGLVYSKQKIMILHLVHT